MDRVKEQTVKTQTATARKRDYALRRMGIALDRVVAAHTDKQRKKDVAWSLLWLRHWRCLLTESNKQVETAMADDLLKHDEVDALFRVEASLRNERNHGFYGKEIVSLRNQGLLVEDKSGLQMTPKGKAHLMMARNGELEN